MVVTQEGSLREQHKRDKLARIKAAAWTLFTGRGYEATTVREVARRAGVASGTVFVYARSKPELLTLVFEDQIEALLAGEVAREDVPAPVLEHLLGLFQRLLDLHLAHPELARVYLRGLFEERAGGKHTWTKVEALTALVARWLAQAGARGEVGPGLDASLAAQSLYGLSYGALTLALSGTVSPAEVRDRVLPAAFALLWRGLRNCPEGV